VDKYSTVGMSGPATMNIEITNNKPSFPKHHEISFLSLASFSCPQICYPDQNWFPARIIKKSINNFLDNKKSQLPTFEVLKFAP